MFRFPQYPHYLIVGPLVTAMSTWILYDVETLGADCLWGVGLLLLYIPLQALLGKLFSKLRDSTAKKTDERVRVTNEFVKAIRVIKMYAWEKPFAAIVDKARREEVDMIRKASYLRGLNLGLFFVSAKVIVFVILVLSVKHNGFMSAEQVFVATALINNLRLAVMLLIFRLEAIHIRFCRFVFMYHMLYHWVLKGLCH